MMNKNILFFNVSLKKALISKQMINTKVLYVITNTNFQREKEKEDKAHNIRRGYILWEVSLGFEINEININSSDGNYKK